MIKEFLINPFGLTDAVLATVGGPNGETAKIFCDTGGDGGEAFQEALRNFSGPWEKSFWFTGETVVEIPQRPSVNHRFNYTTKVWEDPRTLEELQDEARSAVNVARDAFELGGFWWEDHFFDSDAISQQRIQGAIQMAMLAQGMGQPFSIDWTLADNSVITLDGAQMLSVGLALGQHVVAAHTKARLLKQQIAQAQSKEEIETISW